MFCLPAVSCPHIVLSQYLFPSRVSVFLSLHLLPVFSPCSQLLSVCFANFLFYFESHLSCAQHVQLRFLVLLVRLLCVPFCGWFPRLPLCQHLPHSLTVCSTCLFSFPVPPSLVFVYLHSSNKTEFEFSLVSERLHFGSLCSSQSLLTITIFVLQNQKGWVEGGSDFETVLQLVNDWSFTSCWPGIIPNTMLLSGISWQHNYSPFKPLNCFF